MNTVAGTDHVLRRGPLAVDPYAIFAQNLSDVADWKLLFKKVSEFSGRFTGGQNDFTHVVKQIMAEADLSQAGAISIFAILQALR